MSKMKQPSPPPSQSKNRTNENLVVLAETTLPKSPSKPSDKATATSDSSSLSANNDNVPTKPIVIVGGGLVGLTLALALKRHVGLAALSSALGGSHNGNSSCDKNNNNTMRIEIYEQAAAYETGIGAGIGLYPNGLRVLQDISPSLVRDLQAAGYPYLTRRWERHDGSTVVEADDSKLGQSLQQGDENDSWTSSTGSSTSSNSSSSDNEEAGACLLTAGAADNLHHNHQILAKDEKSLLPLQPLGIRRWKLQDLLWRAVQADPDICVHFDKTLVRVEHPANNLNEPQLVFHDGTRTAARLILAADGAKSRIRSLWMMQQLRQPPNSMTPKPISQLKYTGTTCWYGVANVARPERGICFPTSPTATMSKQEQGSRNRDRRRRSRVRHPMGERPTLEESHNNNSSSSSSSSSNLEEDDTSRSTTDTSTSEIHNTVTSPNGKKEEAERTQLHACFFPTGPDEQCFQFHMPTPVEHKDNNWDGTIHLLDDVTKHRTNEVEEDKKEEEQVDEQPPQGTADDDHNKLPPESSGTGGGWTALVKDIKQQECLELAQRLEAEGWNYDKYIKPLYHVEQAIKVPFAMLDPPLAEFHFRFVDQTQQEPNHGDHDDSLTTRQEPRLTRSSIKAHPDTGRVVLVGDAAHPPVPYLGQGLQQGLEDAGTLALLLKQALCVDNSLSCPLEEQQQQQQLPLFQKRLDVALELYSQLRVPRTNQILQQYSQQMGHWQTSRSFCAVQAQGREELLKRQVFFHETHSSLLPGTTYDYRQAVQEAILQHDWPLPTLQEEEEEEEEDETEDSEGRPSTHFDQEFDYEEEEAS